MRRLQSRSNRRPELIAHGIEDAAHGRIRLLVRDRRVVTLQRHTHRQTLAVFAGLRSAILVEYPDGGADITEGRGHRALDLARTYLDADDQSNVAVGRRILRRRTITRRLVLRQSRKVEHAKIGVAFEL